MSVRGVRGAITVEADQADLIVSGTRTLLEKLVQENGIQVADIASCWLTTTADLVSEYPAVAAREMGWQEVPLLCAHEMAVTRGLPRCIRVMIHWNTNKTQKEIQHVYLGEAVKLRPDLSTQAP